MPHPNAPHQKSMKGQRACELKRLHQELGDVIDAAHAHAYELGVGVHKASTNLLGTIKANMDNEALSDADFRQFIRNSLGGQNEAALTANRMP